MSELERLLHKELQRVGKSASALGVPSDPPSGPENAVFDLTATALQLEAPDSAIAPEGVLLEWTERHVGDYDQNGVVTVADITPLASPAYWEMSLSYVDPRGEGSVWPSADGVTPALLYDPVWRMARVDGEPNGMVTISDISPIAKHFNEQCNGYRILRKRPGEPEWTELVQDLYPRMRSNEPPGVVSIPRAATYAPGGLAPEPGFGVHYVFLDQSVPGPGEYDYYVQPVATAAGLPAEARIGTESGHFTVTYLPDPLPVTSPDPSIVTLSALGATSGNAPFGVFFQAASESASKVSAVFWDYDSDGTIDEGSGRQPSSQHIYEAPGHYTATVYALEPGGASASASLDIDVLDNGNSLPRARLSATPQSGPAFLAVTLDASASTDLEGIAAYEWDPLGGGTFLNGGVAPTFDYTYPEGEYDAVVRVRDTSGATATATVHIAVGPIDSEPPTLDITTDLVGGEYAPEVVEFTFSVADPEGGEVTLEIDYEDDQIYDEIVTVTNGDHLRTHLYQSFGQHFLRARVTDDHGLSDEQSISFSLLKNEPPVAQLTADVESGAAPLTVSFDASGSTDPEGQPLQYFWDFDFDGTYVGPLSAVESFTYYEYGTRGAWVRVVDSEGASSQIGVGITTTSGWQLATVIPAGTGRHEVSMEFVDGHPAIAYHRNGTLSFARSDLPDGSSWSVAVLLHTPDFGAVHPSLKVVNGLPAIAYLSDAGELFYIRANDPQGKTWGSPVLVEWISGSGAATDFEIIEGRPAIAWIDSLSHLNYVRAQDADGTAWGATRDLGAHGEFVFNQEIDLDTVDALPTIVASNGSTLFYYRAVDADGALWSPPQIVRFDSTLRRAAALAVPFGLPAGLPTVLYYNEDGLYSIRASDVSGSAWSAPELIATLPTSNDWFNTPDVEVEIVGSGLATLTASSGFHDSSDSFGTSWNPQFGVLDGNLGMSAISYDLVDVGGMPVAAIETPGGLIIARLR